MKPKRFAFRITWLMALVAIVALDFGALRALLDIYYRDALARDQPREAIDSALVFGILPVVNVLTLSVLIGCRRRTAGPFLLGFVTFGAAGLFAYLIVIFLCTNELLVPAHHWLIEHLRPSGQSASRFQIRVANAKMLAIHLIPYLTIAAFGGLLFWIAAGSTRSDPGEATGAA